MNPNSFSFMKPTNKRNISTFAALAILLLVGVSARAGELLNLSTRGTVNTEDSITPGGRGSVGTGDNVLIGGVIVTGSGAKHVLFRAVGASLQTAGVVATATLQDPMVGLYDAKGDILQSNDDWRYGPELEIEATGLQPRDDYESAIIADLTPGNYTAIIRGYAHSSGIALVEVFDLGGASARLAEISTRGNVQGGDNLLIGGFIIGESPTKVLIRAIGPELTAFRVPHALQDPTLELRDASGALLEANDDWMKDNRQAISDTGIAPKDDRESAILRTLPPGRYTALVRGKDNTTGIGLVEIYRLQ